MNWVLGGGIVAALAGLWGYIKVFLIHLKSLFVVTVTLKNTTPTAMSCWLIKNAKRFKTGNFNFNSFNFFVKTKKDYQHVAFEELSNSCIFFYGWKPLFWGQSNNKQSGDNESNTSGPPIENSYSFSYFRGTISFDKVLAEAMDLYNEIKKKGYKKDRFYMITHYGTLGNHNENGSIGTTAESKEGDGYFLANKRLLGYGPEDIGYNDDKGHKFMDALAYPQNVLDAMGDIEKWIKSENWYKEKRIPWKRGWLLYGPPGTGKTSLVRAIGEQFDLPVISFNLSTFTDRDMVINWNDTKERTPCIVLLEDLDAVFDGRENTFKNMTTTKPLGFSTLLNVIDGIENSNGVFLIITTNNIDKIDPALASVNKKATRPGRVDRVIKLDTMNKTCRKKLANYILDGLCDKGMIEQVVQDGEGETGAQFQDRCSKLALEIYWDNQKFFKEREHIDYGPTVPYRPYKDASNYVSNVEN